MKHIGLSIIIPVYNASEWIAPTVEHIFASLKGTAFDAEIIIVDDGSTDDSEEVARSIVVPEHIKLRVVAQGNKGRYLARKKGVSISKKENVLFVDSRVYIDKGSLKFLENKLKSDPDQIWNGHVNIEKRRNIFAKFWDAIVGVAWHKYFRNPRTTSYDIDQFDYYPKGTGFFYVSKTRLLSAMKYFESKTSDLQYSSDDTLLIRYLIKDRVINISPNFSCLYHGRSTFGAFLKHAYTRGQFFIDGFFRRGTRFFYPLIGVFLLFVAACLLVVTNPGAGSLILLVAAVLFILGLFLGSLLYGVAVSDALALAILGIPFTIVYFAGLCRGLARKATNSRGTFRSLSYSRGVLLKNRLFLRGSLIEYLFVGLAYFLALAIITKGTLLNISNSIFGSIGDATAGFMWLNYADRSLSPIVGHTDLVNFPTGEDLGGPSFVAYSLLWLPMRFFAYLFDPITSLNIMMVIGFMSAALSGYWLIKRITGNVLIAFFAGYAIAFTPYALIKSVAHLSYIFSVIFVAILAAFIGLWKKPTVKRAILLGLVVSSAFYTDGYFILLSTVTVLGLAMGGLLYGFVVRFTLSDFLLRLKYGVLALVTFMVIVSPLLVIQLTQGDQVKQSLAAARSNIEGEIRSYNTKPVDFLAPSDYSPVFANLLSVSEMNLYRSTHSNASENTNYIGYGVLLLGAFGCAILLVNIVWPKQSRLKVGVERKSIILIFCVTLTTVPLFLAFMFSPEVVVFGREVTLPGRLMIDHDITLWRVMSRFFIPLHVLLVVFAAISLYILCRYVLPTSSKGSFRKITAIAIVCFFIVLTVVEYAVNIPSVPYNISKEAPIGYSWLKKQKDIHVIAELPLVDPLDSLTAEYLTFQTIHGKKLVNMKNPNNKRLHGALGSYANTEVLDFLRLRGVDAVITRAGSCDVHEWGEILHESRFSDTLQLCIYRLNPSASSDTLFALYGKGFVPGINSFDQSEIVFAEPRAEINIRQFDMQTSRPGDAIMTAKLNNLSGGPIRWAIIQNSTTLQEGVVSTPGYESYAAIDVRIVADKPVEVILTSSDDFQIGQATLRDVVVSKLP